MNDELHDDAFEGSGDAPGPFPALPHDFQSLADLARGYWPARILLTAVETDLFDHLGAARLTPEELAAEADTDPRGTRVLTEALVGLGLLVRHDDRIANSELALRYLVRSSDDWRGDLFRYLANLWARWDRLTRVLRVGAEGIGPEWGRAETRAFYLAMHQGKPEAGEDLVAELDLHDVERIVDLGGGSGSIARAFAEAVPDAQIVVVDRAEALDVAREFLPDDLIEGRIVLLEEDFVDAGVPLAGEPPGPYDLALISSVIHLLGPEDNASLLASVYEALQPGGQVVIRDFLIEEDGPLEPFLYSVSMLVNTPEGRCYRFAEIKRWLHQAGFGQVDRRPFEGAVQLVTARRA